MFKYALNQSFNSEHKLLLLTGEIFFAEEIILKDD